MLRHCESCTCPSPAPPPSDDPSGLERQRQRAVTDAEILAILDDCDRLARIGKEGRGAE